MEPEKPIPTYTRYQIEQWCDAGKIALESWRDLLITVRDERWLEAKKPTRKHLNRVNQFIKTLEPLREFAEKEAGWDLIELGRITPIYKYDDQRMVQLRGIDHLSHLLYQFKEAYDDTRKQKTLPAGPVFRPISTIEQLTAIGTNYAALEIPFAPFGWDYRPTPGAETPREIAVKCLTGEIDEAEDALARIDGDKARALHFLARNPDTEHIFKKIRSPDVRNYAKYLLDHDWPDTRENRLKFIDEFNPNSSPEALRKGFARAMKFAAEPPDTDPDTADGK